MVCQALECASMYEIFCVLVPFSIVMIQVRTLKLEGDIAASLTKVQQAFPSIVIGSYVNLKGMENRAHISIYIYSIATFVGKSAIYLYPWTK